MLKCHSQILFSLSSSYKSRLYTVVLNSKCVQGNAQSHPSMQRHHYFLLHSYEVCFLFWQINIWLVSLLSFTRALMLLHKSLRLIFNVT